MIGVDNRERRSVVPTELKKYKIPLEFANLEVGDYVIRGEIVFVVSRKRAAGDYVQSMTSGHLNNELYNLSFNYPLSLLIVEGHIGEALLYRKIKRQNYLSSLVGNIVKRSPDGASGVINMVMVDTPYDTALLLKFLHDKITKKGELVRLPKAERVKMGDEDRKLYITASLPGVGPKRAKDLLIEFGSIRSLSNAEESGLMKVRGIGPKMAPLIRKILNEKYLEGKNLYSDDPK